MKLPKLAAIATIGAMGICGANAAAASAIEKWATHPSDPSYAYYNSVSGGITGCDEQVDGNRVRAWYGVQGVGNQPAPWAPSGGCSPGVLQNVNMIRICVENEGCGPWTRW